MNFFAVGSAALAISRGLVGFALLAEEALVVRDVDEELLDEEEEVDVEPGGVVGHFDCGISLIVTSLEAEELRVDVVDIAASFVEL